MTHLHPADYPVGAAPEVLYSLASAGISPLAANSPEHVSPPKIRKDFPETWIWDLMNDIRLRSQTNCNICLLLSYSVMDCPS